MATPYIGEIRMFAGNFPPNGWAFCDGALQPISENEALFALIGTTYGGDGQSTFALPDLRGRVPVHQGTQAGNNYVIGQLGGSETVTLNNNQIPAHNHLVGASTAMPVQSLNPTPITGVPGTMVPASPAKPRLYAAPGANVAMAPNAVQPSGGNQPHENMAPFLAINFIIALFGVFPSQS